MSPMSVLAETKPDLSSGDKLDELAEGDYMNTNHGTIKTNNGDVMTNNDRILTNYGTVTTNEGSIGNNYGIVTNAENGSVINNEADGSVTGGGIIYMNGGTATNCKINYMTGGTARGANTKIGEYAGGNIEKTIPLENIKSYALGFTEDKIVWVAPLPTGGSAVSAPEPAIPESPYRVFLFDTVPQVKNAAQGTTVELKMDDWNTLPLWFMKEIAARRDLTIHITYRYEGQKYDVTFPAGMVINCQDDEGKEIDYFGPLKLADMAYRDGGICSITE